LEVADNQVIIYMNCSTLSCFMFGLLGVTYVAFSRFTF